MDWFICPIVSAAVSAASGMDTIINSMLTLDTSIFSNTPYQQAWQNFRDIAVVLIIIAALVMVISQAAGVEMMSAYTMKKVLPRILFAAVFITLSWSLLDLAASFSNDMGEGVRALIETPFSNAGLTANFYSGGGATVLLGGAWSAAIGILGLLALAGTALLAALIAFFILVFRQLLFVIIVITAPFAIACYVLPNTQRAWKMWRDTLISILVVFPIISGFIAIGRVFAAVLTSGHPDALHGIMAIIAYFAPYVLIPKAFGLAGGFIGSLHGQVNGMHGGIFNRLKGFRGKQPGERWNKLQRGELYRNRGVGRLTNSAGFAAGALVQSKDKLGYLRGGAARQNARAQWAAITGAGYSKTENAQVTKDNDYLNMAQTYRTEHEARSKLATDFGLKEDEVSNAIGAARAAGGFGYAQQVHAARALADSGTGYSDLRNMQDTVHRVVGNNRAAASDMLGYINAVSSGKRSDLKVGYGKQMDLYDKNVQGKMDDNEIQSGYMEAIKGNKDYEILGGKPAAVKNLMPALQKEFQRQLTVSANPAAANNTISVKDALGNEKQVNEQEHAREEVGRLKGIIDKLQANGMYGSSQNVQISTELAYTPTVGSRAQVGREAEKVVYTRVPGTNQTTVTPNLDYDPAKARGYAEQAPHRSYDPEDPIEKQRMGH